MAKKVLKEEAEKQAPEVVVEDSAAMESLKPNSKPVDDPKSRYETLSAMIGTAATMRDEDLTKWYDQMLASTTGAELSKNVPDGAAASNAATLNMKPSAAHEELKHAAAEDLSKILGEQEGLSEEFKSKTQILFEAALTARLGLESARIEEEIFEAAAEELYEAVQAISEKLDEYLDYTADKWLEENEVAIESTLRNEITEDFVQGLKEVFDGYVDIPESKIDVVEQLSKTVEELETRLNEMIAENADLKSNKEESIKKDITEELAQGLTLVESEKLKEFAKAIDTDDVDEFKTKLETIKDSHFVKDAGKKSVLTEQLEEVDEDNLPPEEKRYNSPNMKNYVQAISRTVKR